MITEILHPHEIEEIHDCNGFYFTTFISMITILNHINNLELSFDHKKIIAEQPHINPTGTPLKMDIPVDISFNEDWSIQHACNCEDETISFSKTHNWNFINKLFSKFYEDEMLELLAKAFDSLHVFESTKSKFMFLTETSFNDETAAIYAIPQVTFNYYKCDNCCSEFLCRLSEGLPRPADPRLPNGMEGRLMIHEIVQFEMYVEEDFITSLKRYSGHI